jgi:iron(III) transport system substrate-binding protein
MRINRGRSALVAACLTVILAACGASPTAGGKTGAGGAPGKAEQLYNEVAGLSGQQRRDRLVELAEKEGQLNLYTSMTSDVTDAVVKAFSDSFKIKVNLYRAGSETVLQRVLQEQAAGYAGNDVIETNATEMLALAKEGALADYRGGRRDAVPEVGRFKGWTATRFNLFAPSWNTALVNPGEEPKRWEDLADPKWDGKLSMELADYDWYLTLYGYWQSKGKSVEEIDRLFADMAQGAKIVKGHTVQGELMSAGQFAVTASNYTYLVEQARKKGAPVEYRPLAQPVIARANGAGLMKSAKNPAAAVLFVDWLLQEGQKVLAGKGLTPAVVDGDDPLKDVEVIPVDAEKLLGESDAWSKKYEAVVSRGDKVDK